MHRDSGEVWPEVPVIGTFDITVYGVEDYPEATGHIFFVCPNGQSCGVLIGPSAFAPGDGDGRFQHVWEWDGDLEHPTLTPSINCVGGCGWHGHITNGVMK